jgi:nicotinate-nucleotide--dimethylbenzimidazole phosphoribosyltransferase
MKNDFEARAEARQQTLLKPPGSLGRLEELAIRLSAAQASDTPQSRPAACLLFAADHPVTKHGVSPYPSAVTATMVSMFARGMAASTVMAKHLGVPVTVIDVGVDTPYEVASCVPGVSHERANAEALRNAGDLRTGEAMSVQALSAALSAGDMAVQNLPVDTKVLLLGEMGIGNTTPAAAVYAGLLGLSAEEATGRGTGADDGILKTKIAVVADALATLQARDPMTVLRQVGGREIAALVGAIRSARARGIAVVVDGFIVGAAAAVYLRMLADSEAEHGLFFSHTSHERGHARALSVLGAKPYLDLQMRLGESTGALALLPLLDLACALHNGMATFADAGL